MRVAFTIPGPPVAKERARTVRTRKGKTRTFTPERTETYEKHVGVLAWAATRGRDWAVTGNHAVEIRVFVAADRSDLDNIVKAVLDGCTPALWVNDKSVRRIVAELHVDRAKPRVEVEAWPVLEGARVVEAGRESRLVVEWQEVLV